MAVSSLIPHIGDWTEQELRRIIRQEIHAGSPANTTAAMSLIDTRTVDTVAASVHIPIPGGYRDLFVCGRARSDNATKAATFVMQFNGDATAVYGNWGMYSDAGLAAPANLGGTGGISAAVGHAPAGLANLQPIWAAYEAYIPLYAVGDTNKTWQGRGGGYWDNTGVANSALYMINGGTWRSNAAITSLKFSFNAGNINTGSTISIYGMAPY